jgi:hypothetical protein
LIDPLKTLLRKYFLVDINCINLEVSANSPILEFTNDTKMEQLILRVENVNTRLDKLNPSHHNDGQQETPIIRVFKNNKYSLKQKALLGVAVVIILIFVIILIIVIF